MDKKHLINKRNVKGETPLYLACKFGNTEVITISI
jgi:hypothetical protein